MTRPRPAVLVLAAGAVALAAGTAGIAWAGSGMHVESVGSRPTAQPEPSVASRESANNETSLTPRTTDSPYRTLERRDATQLPRPDRAPRPTSIDIPALAIAAPVDVVGVADDGQVEVPVDVRRAGWYRFSAKPGAGAGSVVIVGHRDGVDQGGGAFIDLGNLRPGDLITVTTEQDRALTYEVVARESFAKSKVPLRELFSRSGPERLTLITCGGPFDPARLEYTDNIVVTALPVDTAADLPETR